MTADPIEHEIRLKLASGALLQLLYFSDREQRWIFSYDYVGKKEPGKTPDIVNEVRLVANYATGRLDSQIVLSMHVIIPARLGREYFVGVDISPGAKTYLEFTYHRREAFRLVEICKGARDSVYLGGELPGLVRPIEFPFPIPDQIPIEYGTIRVPFRTNADDIAHFELPMETLR